MKRGLLFVFLLTWIANIGNAQVSKTQVGASYYDLQTNNSIERRIVIDPTSKKRTIVYTGSAANDGNNGAFNDRGTGYYFYSGTGPMTPVTTFPGRIESKRVGWPTPLYLKGGKEIIITHQAGTSSGLFSVRRPAAGTGAWTETVVNNGSQTWPRACNSGDSIFLISSLSTQNNSNNMFGMLGGIGFKRSYDGGATWTPDTVADLMDSIKGLNLNKYPNVPNSTGQSGNVIGGDQYSLDVKGKMVAVLTGSSDVTLFTSNDFGNTWNMTTLVEGDNTSGDTLPRLLRSGGDFSVLIDNNDKIHCFWALNYSNGFTFELDKAGIVYWNNITPGMKPKIIYKTSYGLENNTNALIYLPYYTQVIGTNQTSPSVPTQVFYGSGYTCRPSSGIDASNALYLSYQRTRGISDTNRYKQGKLIDGRGNMMSECYVIKSTDNGQTWLGPINVSNSDSTEDAYASMARFVDDSVHIVYQEDSFAGAIVNNSNSSPNLNKLIYARVATKDIINPTDITAPILNKKDSVEYFSGGVIKNNSEYDTLKILAGCNLESVFQDTFTNISSYLFKHIIEAYDDNEKMTIYIDTPANFNKNVPGTYYINVRVKDANNNPSTFIGINFSSGLVVYSWDTIKMVLLVDNADVIPPVISMTKKEEYIALGSVFTLPTPVATVTDNNPCGTPTVTLPMASDVNVNVVGVNNLVVRAKDINNNTSTDTLKVYVGTSPASSFTNQALANNKVTATGTTVDIAEIFPNTSYIWKTKTKNGAFVNSLPTTKDLVYAITSSTLSFDSLCYEVKNIFNTKIPSLKTVVTCKELKYTKGSVGIQSVADNNIKLEIAPNPNSGNFKLQYEGIVKSTEAIITIQDLNGRTIYDQKIFVKGSGEIPVRLTNISNGTYFINAQIGDNHFLRKLEISK